MMAGTGGGKGTQLSEAEEQLAEKTQRLQRQQQELLRQEKKMLGEKGDRDGEDDVENHEEGADGEEEEQRQQQQGATERRDKDPQLAAKELMQERLDLYKIDIEENELNLRRNIILGGVLYFDMLEIPPQPKKVGNWVICQLETPQVYT